MRTSGWIAFGIIVLAILAGTAWWWYGSTPAPAAPAETATTTVGTMYVPDNLLLGTDATSTAGTYLIGFNAMAVYTFANDADGVSNCAGQCATNWPPYIVPNASVLDRTQSGVDGTVGSITRADGGIQVTYNGKPLYFYKGDTKDGDINGQGVGGVWYLVAAKGPAGPAVVGVGEHCGGFIQNAPECGTGLHCVLATGHPDTGGTCVKD